MNKSITSLLLALLTMAFSFAQDADAKKILDGVSAKFKTFKSVKSTFTIKIENSAGKAMGSKSGTVYMKGTKYRVSITGQEIFCDGTTIWTYDKGNNEVTITSVDASSASITPQKLFTNFYDKDFNYKSNGEKKSGTKTLQEIELTPKDKTKPYSKVIVTVDKATSLISSTKVIEKNGNKYTTSVGKMDTTTAIPDATFTFDAKKYPGVEVVDLR